MNKNLSLGFCALVLAVLACGSTSSTPSATSPVLIAPSATGPSATGTPAPVAHRVESGGVAITVNSVEAALDFQGFMSPDAGNVYVVLDVTLENVSLDELPYNPLYFKLKDAEFFEYSSNLLAPEPSLKAGDLAVGEKARGNVAFEVPETSRELVMSFEPLVLFGGYETIRISIGDAPKP